MPPLLGKLAFLNVIPRHNAHSFTPRVIAIILILLFIFLGWTFYWLLDAEKQSLMEERKHALTDHLRLAVSICRRYDAKSEAGGMTRSAAIDQAAESLNAMRYGSMNGGYFYVLDNSGFIRLHPLRPDMASEDLPTEGGLLPFLREIVDLSNSESQGYTEYNMKWLGGGETQHFIAAYKTYEPWNWVIVTEANVSEIETQIARKLGRQVLVLFLLSAALALVLSTTLKRLVLSGVDRMIDVSRRLSAGELTARIETSPTDEMSVLAKSFNEMAEGIQTRDEQIRLVTRASVFALAKLAEARDRETGGHLLRVREYTTILANALRKHPKWKDLIDAEFILDIYDATLLHDIGKVAIPDSILLKPAALDDGERAIMMSHTLVGANTIRMARRQMQVKSSFLEMAEQITRSHHERWDGEGYVECLSGEKIPPPARIFTVADIYDALTTQRPYKPAYTHHETLEAMKEDRGKRFDPEVFDAFLEVADEFNRVRIEFADD